jgi:serine/threonine protein kinase
LLHIPSVDQRSIRKEVEAIKKLCGPDTHVNIIQVLDHGHLSNPIFYFIDMELCDLNLHDYIHGSTPPNLSGSVPYFSRGDRVESSLQIWIVMSQIASGVEYIHRQHQVHRDIKPANGDTLACVTDVSSFVLVQQLGMETGGFWAIV